MPHFYLNLCNGNGFTQDEEGVELPDVSASRRAAIEALRDVAASELRDGQLDLGSFIEVEDADHQFVTRVSFAEAVQISTHQG